MANFCLISIHVDDLDKAVDFYTNKLGFEARPEPAPRGVKPLKSSSGPSPVLVKTDRPAQGSYPENAQVVLAVETSDIHQTMQEMQAKGVKFIQDKPQPFPVGMLVQFKDPAGNVLELIQWS